MDRAGYLFLVGRRGRSCRFGMGHFFYHLVPELPELDLVELFGEEPPAPCPAVHPVDDPVHGKEYLVFVIDRHEFPSDPRVTAPASANGNEIVHMDGFYQVKRAGLDAHPALDTLVFVEFGYPVPDFYGTFPAIIYAGAAAGAEAFGPDRADPPDDPDLV